MKRALLALLAALLFAPAAAQRPSSAVRQPSPTAQRMERAGLVDVARLDTTLRVDLMYARADNFTGRVLYGDLTEAYLHPEAARALVEAQRLLRTIHPGYRLLVCDAARPMSVQQTMWEAVAGTPSENYVSNPANGGGTHNYGFAVDVTIYDLVRRDTIPMGVPVDHLFSESHIDREAELVRTGRISTEAKANRELLRYVMMQAGFHPLRTEYWHFNYKGYRREGLRRAGYRVIE